jgi:hypothetical protein
MSYCRFSDDNWKSDVYAYESDRGFELHIASIRRVGDIPALPSILDVGTEEFVEAYQAHMTAVSAAERVPINGPHDGKSFTFGTLQELFYCLTQLQADGYHVPDFTFEAIKEEMNEEPTQ